MSESIQAIRGMPDLLPVEALRWQHIESVIAQLMHAYGYEEVRTPIIERTHLFARSVGEHTDIVEKEMYLLEDRKGDSLALRPEGTASVVRAAIASGLLRQGPQKWIYQGPMFRYERPQKGRQRQFHQFGLECFGLNGPLIEAECLQFCHDLWARLGLASAITLDINHLGNATSREAYTAALVEYLSEHISMLDADSQRRLTHNPLRILDSKHAGTRSVLDHAPKLENFLCEADQLAFQALQATLDQLGIAYTINPRLVRGLDYYTGLVFEWVSDALGAQSAVCAGGRYDGLVEQLGGDQIPAVGFAIGLERLVEITRLLEIDLAKPDQAIIILPIAGIDEAGTEALKQAQRIRDALPQLQVSVDLQGGKVTSQFKRASKAQARFALVLGEEELRTGKLTLKDLVKNDQSQYETFEQLIGAITHAS